MRNSIKNITNNNKNLMSNFMKRIKFSLLMIMLMSLGLFQCSLDVFFENPTTTFIEYKLIELPTEVTKINVTVDVKNNDSQDGDIKKATYKVNILGVETLEMTYNTPFLLKGGETKRLTFPLTFTTANAVTLLDKLSEPALTYTVTGEFDAETYFGDVTLPINQTGSATVSIDIDDYFTQPEIIYDETAGFDITTTLPLFPPYPTSVEAKLKKITIKNLDENYGAKVNKIVYVVKIAGNTSNEMTFDNTNSSTQVPFDMGKKDSATDTKILIDLPVSFPFSASLISLATGGYQSYTISGKAYVTADIGNGAQDFILPIYSEGTTKVF